MTCFVDVSSSAIGSCVIQRARALCVTLSISPSAPPGQIVSDLVYASDCLQACAHKRTHTGCWDGGCGGGGYGRSAVNRLTFSVPLRTVCFCLCVCACVNVHVRGQSAGECALPRSLALLTGIKIRALRCATLTWCLLVVKHFSRCSHDRNESTRYLLHRCTKGSHFKRVLTCLHLT